MAVVREVWIPISGAPWPTLRAEFPLTEDAWDRMIEVLNVMKPGLVRSEQESEVGAG